ncbi:mechanosensitive ion channel domain-containing protein [Aureivirga sp. CE67]|uniref:mechanosensitive ion channel domain-containing protein n=1 Tax=Aureivirga sp. CE67 TaxID=1788983 RepID=UPI0018CBE8AE|nr:mechanosensitive ion channel domain-containing protein [Aureivirga sp. CE67]
MSEEFVLLYKEIFFTVLLLIFLGTVRVFLRRILTSFMEKKSIDPNRKKIILNILYIFLYSIVGIILFIIWGVNLKEFTLFISSILAVLGVGFVAQWSVLSNLTSSVILFFYHPVRIGDRVRILDKDFELKGEVVDLTGFFFFLKTDNGEDISFSNTIILQKGIEIISSTNEEKIEEEGKEELKTENNTENEASEA